MRLLNTCFGYCILLTCSAYACSCSRKILGVRLLLPEALRLIGSNEGFGFEIEVVGVGRQAK